MWKHLPKHFSLDSSLFRPLPSEAFGLQLQTHTGSLGLQLHVPGAADLAAFVPHEPNLHVIVINERLICHPSTIYESFKYVFLPTAMNLSNRAYISANTLCILFPRRILSNTVGKFMPFKKKVGSIKCFKSEGKMQLLAQLTKPAVLFCVLICFLPSDTNCRTFP